ncbi:hypothetical protein CR513_07191, partial [Mucuna pruriens]
MVSKVFAIGSLPLQIIETLIVMIPKVDTPCEFKELKPNSFCNTAYKNYYEGQFFAQKRNSNNVIVLQEIVCNHISKRKDEDVTSKIDLEKAYDVDRVFFKYSLFDFSLPHPTVKLIMHYVMSYSLSIIWNGGGLSNFY